MGLAEVQLEVGELLGRNVELNRPGFLRRCFREQAPAEAEMQYDAVDGMTRLRNMLDHAREAVAMLQSMSRPDLDHHAGPAAAHRKARGNPKRADARPANCTLSPPLRLWQDPGEACEQLLLKANSCCIVQVT